MDTLFSKPLFAAYLNMARNNCLMVINHIAERVGQKHVSDEDAILSCTVIQSLNSTQQSDVAKKVIENLESHFPFIKLLARSGRFQNPEDYYTLLARIINQLNALRNYHTHHQHLLYDTDGALLNDLRFVFDTSRREVRKRFNLTAEDVKHLVRKTATKVNGQRQVAEIKGFHYAFARADGTSLSLKGIAFLISLLLEKKYAYLFLNQISGFKNQTETKYKATLQTYCFYNIHLPQPRLQSQDTQMGLMLDMLEELKRCPGILYEHLNEGDKQIFFKGDDNQTNEDDIQPDPVLKRGGDNRFAYFALRYLKLTNALPQLQFQTDLGNYYFKVYTKTVDGEQRLRRLSKGVKAFGHSDDFTANKMPPEWKALVKDTHQLPADYPEPYIANTIPHYHIVNNQIGVSINGKLHMPQLTIPLKNPEPQMWLSVYELPALMFYHILTDDKTDYPKVTQILANHRKDIIVFFKAINNKTLQPGFTEATLNAELTKRKLKLQHIPKPLLAYLLGQATNPVMQKAENKIAALIADTEKLLARVKKEDENDEYIENKDYKKIDKRYKPLKAGNMADFLARDMLLLQPAVDKIKGKATGTLFQVLQARLAFYGRDRFMLKQLYRECNLIQSANPHPFLHELDAENTSSILQYYYSYLKKRLKYLNDCQKLCLKGNVGSPKLHFLHLGAREKRDGDAYYINLANEFTKQPINLPRGLFMELLVSHFNINVGKPVNTVYLLKHYLNQELQDDYQSFYNFKRGYKVFDKYHDTRATNSRDALKPQYYDTEQLILQAKKIKTDIADKIKKGKAGEEDAEKITNNYNYYNENEKQLRHSKACDTVLWLMVRKMFGVIDARGVDTDAFKLQDVMPNAETGILSQIITLKLLIHSKFITQADLKVKNYGDFRRFLKDKRLETLLPYYPQQTIDKAIIEKELEAYDKVRVNIHKIILDFEGTLFAKHPDIPLRPEGFIDFKAYMDKFFEQNPDDPKKDLIVAIRNAFAHNQYPNFEDFENKIGELNQPTIAEKLECLLSQWLPVTTLSLS